MATNDAPLSVKNLKKVYPSFTLGELSFDLQPGAITGFIGRNGAGKTTTINSILGFIQKDSGEVRFHGLNMEEKTGEIKRKIGFVSAGMTFYTRKKLKTITAVTASFFPGWNDGVYRQYMARFQLDESKTPAQLSNGMKIKYALALALSRGADTLILDEPTSGLDPVSREELIEIFLSLRDEGKTILFSTHITSDLEKCADHILFIRNGELTADEPLNRFTASYAIVECPDRIPENVLSQSLGKCRRKDGFTVLVKAEAVPSLSLPHRPAELDEIIVHLEKEGENQ